MPGLKPQEEINNAFQTAVLLQNLMVAARNDDNNNKIIALLKANKGIRLANSMTPLRYFWNFILHDKGDEEDLKKRALLLMQYGDTTLEDLTSTSWHYSIPDCSFISWFMSNRSDDDEQRKKLMVKLLGFCKVVARATYFYHQFTLLHDLALLPAKEADKDLWNDLYKAGANINAQNTYGETPLHLAVHVANVPMVKWLIEKQAAFYIRDNKEKRYTALELARDMKLRAESPNDTAQFSAIIALLENNDPRKKLDDAIKEMSSYGIRLDKDGSAKGKVAIKLAAALELKVQKFFEIFNKKEVTPKVFDDFKASFSVLLHSEDKKMRQYRKEWSTIAINIALAFTGIGVLAIAAKLIYSKVTAGRPLFFYQKPRTTGEEHVKAIEVSCTNLKNLF